jgi:hypothetical protein
MGSANRTVAAASDARAQPGAATHFHDGAADGQDLTGPSKAREAVEPSLALTGTDGTDADRAAIGEDILDRTVPEVACHPASRDYRAIARNATTRRPPVSRARTARAQCLA